MVSVWGYLIGATCLNMEATHPSIPLERLSENQHIQKYQTAFLDKIIYHQKKSQTFADPMFHCEVCKERWLTPSKKVRVSSCSSQASLRRVMHKFMKERVMSQQETCHLMLGLPIVHCTHRLYVWNMCKIGDAVFLMGSWPDFTTKNQERKTYILS